MTVDGGLLQELRENCRRFLAERASVTDLHDESARDALWRESVEMGWPAMLLPESAGGLGFTWVEAATVAHEVGRQCAPIPILSFALVAPVALSSIAGSETAGEMARATAAGDERVASIGLVNHPGIDAELHLSGDDASATLDGSCPFVLDAAAATAFLVCSQWSDGRPAVVLARPGGGCLVEPLELLDQTRSAGVVTFDGAPVEVLVSGPEAGVVRRRMTDALMLGVACDSAGLAEAAVELTIDYAKNRVQFGRPIGSFQAIKHRLADCYLQLQGSLAVVEAAALGMDAAELNGAGRASPRLAVTQAAESAARIAGDGILVHGAIGFTWEHVMHRYLKRSLLNQQLAGPLNELRVSHLASRYPEVELTS